ncbi:MAG: orotate phosphoribosyltransferase [Clostridiales bacterium]|nr:orotate phosphoribosyltransferase [Clostridiales bacterium]
MKDIVEQLFNTKALVVTDGTPFLYTSGEVGPFYINTHYLYGDKEMSEKTLEFINENKELHDFEEQLTRKIMNQYYSNDIFHDVVDQLVNLIKEKVNLNEVDMISGGERRDWFFSIPVAKLLLLPHVFIYKDHHISNHILDGKNLLHICDLINSASSYTRDWKPIINKNKGIIKETVSVVDRNQGGKDILKSVNIKLHSLISFSKDTFENAKDCGKINKEQLEMIEKYLKDTNKFLLDFVDNNQEYIEKLKTKGTKQEKRVKLLLKKYYELI